MSKFDSSKRPPPSRLRRLAAAATVTAVACSITTALADPAAAATSSAPVASGSDWAVRQVAGGYRVAVTLPSTLPVRDDIPEIVADGRVLGAATESRNGKTLSIMTTSAKVASASSVSWQWSSGGDSVSSGSTTLPAAQKTTRKAQVKAADDPTVDPTAGTGAYTVADYNFGPQSTALTDIGGIRGEVEGRIYLPSSSGAHPLVIFLHGRHSACYVDATLKGANVWPCPAGDTPILSYAGYDGAGDALAADGYTVVSISANAINANDNQLSPDAGANSRGQLVLDTLSWLKRANAGDAVSFTDESTTPATPTSLDEALVAGRATSPDPSETMSAADLVGSMDFTDIGLMGHSRGGEGAVSAGTLNEGLAHPWAIKSIFALAPIDFTRTTLPDVDFATLLPYCDGDVSDQQGQHFYADSRDAFNDNVLRSDIWVMGTDHDFYNTSWTPPYPAASDDWSRTTDPTCGTDPSVAATSIRLSAAQQYQTGSAYLAGWFELTLGGASDYQGMFDGSGDEPSSVAAFADVRTVADQPANQREDITSFKTVAGLSTTATGSAVACASRYGRTTPQALPSCTSAAVGLTSQQQPYWTPANYAPNVPLNPVTHFTWTDTSGALSVTVPKSQRDVSGYQEMTVTMSPDENVTTGTDVTLDVTDTAGHTWSAPVSSLNKWGVTRMPASTGSGATLLDKIVLQQVHVPTATLESAGLDLSKISRVRFTGAVGADGTSSGGVYLSDLQFDSKGLGTPDVMTRPTVNVASTSVEEGNGPNTDEVAVYLSKASTDTTTAWLSVLGSATGTVGLAAQKVSFEPGQTCQDVEVPVTGDSTAGTAASTAYKFAVSDSTDAVLGSADFGTLTVREDDGVTGGTAAPAVGVQGDACAEHDALADPGTLTINGALRPGAAVAVTGAGYRAGESVTLTADGAVIDTATAGDNGKVAFVYDIPADQAAGTVTLAAVGAGSGYTSTSTVGFGATTTLTVPAKVAYGTAAKATVHVSGATDGTVTLRSGSFTRTVKLGAAGDASTTLPATLSIGRHTVSARYDGSATSQASTTVSKTVTVVKATTATSLSLSAKHVAKGGHIKVAITVTGHHGGAWPSAHLTVSVREHGKTARTTVGLAAGQHGKRTVTVTLGTKGTAHVSATYAGSARYRTSTSGAKTVTVG